MKWIAALGQNIQFVAFCAHAGVAALLVEHTRWWMALLIIGGAAVKEFWFDARYETNPRQTSRDNWEDFLGWSLGALVGMALA